MAPGQKDIAIAAQQLIKAQKPVLLLASQSVDGGPENAALLAKTVARLGEARALYRTNLPGPHTFLRNSERRRF